MEKKILLRVFQHWTWISKGTITPSRLLNFPRINNRPTNKYMSSFLEYISAKIESSHSKCNSGLLLNKCLLLYLTRRNIPRASYIQCYYWFSMTNNSIYCCIRSIFCRIVVKWCIIRLFLFLLGLPGSQDNREFLKMYFEKYELWTASSILISNCSCRVCPDLN